MALLVEGVHIASDGDVGVVNFVVPAEGNVVAEAVKVVEELVGNNPGAVIVSREELRLEREGIGPELRTEAPEKGM